jgi:glycosyltransferase involved in cell wall biosynthesis
VHDVAYHAGDHESRRVPRWGPDFLISRSDRLIVHGKSMRAEAELLYPRKRGRIDILPHRPITRYRTIAERHGMRQTAASGVTVLFFGRIFAYKGLDVLIRSAAQIIADFPDIRFVVAGRGEDMERYRRMLPSPRHFDIRDRFIPDTEAAQLFTDADIVVLPYIEASQSGVLAIASGFGKAVVVTDVGELGQSVQHGVTGLVIPPNDPVALAQAVSTLAGNPALRQRLGEAGRLAAAARQEFAQAALRIYEAAVPAFGRRQHVLANTEA